MHVSFGHKHLKLSLSGIVWTKMGLLAIRKCSGAKGLPVRPRHKKGTVACQHCDD